MTMNEIAREMGFELLTPAAAASAEAPVDRAHASDLLSDVLANAPAGGILLTIQVHMNVIAVALHASLAAVVFTSGMLPDDAVKARAAEQKLPLYSAKESTFDAAGRLYVRGLRGGASRA